MCHVARQDPCEPCSLRSFLVLGLLLHGPPHVFALVFGDETVGVRTCHLSRRVLGADIADTCDDIKRWCFLRTMFLCKLFKIERG